MHATSETPCDKDASVEIIRLLLDAGADVNAIHEKNYASVIHYTVCYNNQKALQLIVDAGADVNYVDTRDERKESALHGAVRSHCAENVKILIAAGADISAKNSNGVTALKMAENFGDSDIVKLLRQREIPKEIQEQ